MECHLNDKPGDPTKTPGTTTFSGSDTIRGIELSLDVLPLEVLHMVCRRLTHKEVTLFRLVCRLFATVGIEHLAEGAYLCFSLHSFKDLEALANTALSKRITSLLFVTEHLSGLLTYDEWKAREDTHQKGRRFLRFSPEVGRLEKYSVFKQPYKEIEHIIQNGIHRQSLQTFFQNCPNLKTLAVSSAMGIWNPMGSDSGNAYTTAFEKGFRKLHIEHRQHYSTVELAEVMRLVATAGIQPERLAAGFLPLESIRESNPDFGIIRNAMSSLKTLVLKVVNQPSRPSGPPNLSNGFFSYTAEDIDAVEAAADGLEKDLSTFIATATDLVHLRVVLGQATEDRMIDGCLLYSLFDRDHSHLFPCLRSLSLESINTFGEGLKTFFLSRRDTITFVRLKDVSLEDDRHQYSWMRFFQDLSTQMPKIEHFMMYGTQIDTEGTVWEFGDKCGRYSSWRTHAMDSYIRKGGSLPVDEASASAQVPNPVMYCRHGDLDDVDDYISTCIIKDPKGYCSGFVEELDDKFWVDHFWRFDACH